MAALGHDGATIHYDTRGSGPPLVFLHGGWLDRDLWTPQVERFAEAHTVVTPDLRGHGDSTTDDPFDIDRMAADVAALCEQLGAERPILVGLSLGSLVAQQFAAAHPDRLAGLVLAGTVRSVPPVPGPEAGRRLLAPRGPAHAWVRLWGPAATFRTLLGSVESTEGTWLALDGAARSYALDCIDAYDPGEFLRVLDTFYEFRPLELGGLAVPTLLVHGDHEASAVVAQNRRLARTLPDAERVVIEDAGHLLNRDAPEKFDAALSEFLDERVHLPA